jgi:hypothetical protein
MARSAYSARTTRTALTFERLEDRSVPATAVLSAGVLTVTGTAGNDTIVLQQANGRVSISGIAATFSSASIQKVVVNSGAGNDTVSLSGLKAQPWSKAITVNSSAGEDTFKILDGRNVYCSGANQSLSITAAGANTLNGKALDWFDFNIHDTALRQLLKTDFADKAVNRTEMLAVLRQAEKDGTVTANEFTDLKAVANNTSLFGSFTYVADLTRNVVLGNTANAHYQGTTLGNLAAGWTGAKLEKLVGKWFLGTDHPDASYPGQTVTYVTAAGTLFGSGGPKYSDVYQGAVGDCYFVATLGEIALKSPQSITSMFIVNGDSTYTVRFYNNGQARYVTVDSKLPTYGGGYFLYANMGDQASNPNNVLWVALAEKAYAQLNECSWLRPAAWGGGVNSYNGIEGGWFDDVTAQVANRVATDYYVNGTADATALQNAFNAGKLIGFASTQDPANANIVGNHQYVVVGYNATTKVVTLFNPWGINNGSQYPGLVQLSLSQLTDSFDYWAIA